MARMHSRAKGKSGSTKPSKRTIPAWFGYSPKEVEMLVIKLRKEGLMPSKIGIVLRDNYGIGDVKLVCKKSVTKILEEHGLLPQFPEDLTALIKKALSIRKHLEKNKKDMTAKRGLQLTESKIKRLVKYYKRVGKLSSDWTYDPEKLKALI